MLFFSASYLVYALLSYFDNDLKEEEEEYFFFLSEKYPCDSQFVLENDKVRE